MTPEMLEKARNNAVKGGYTNVVKEQAYPLDEWSAELGWDTDGFSLANAVLSISLSAKKAKSG